MHPIHGAVSLSSTLCEHVCVLACLCQQPCSPSARHEIDELQGQITAARERYKDNITTSAKGKLSAIPTVSCSSAFRASA